MDQDDKPPAPPLRLTSNMGGFTVSLPVDLRPLPKEPEEKSKHSKSKKKGKGDGHYEARWPQRRGLFYGVGRRSSLNKSDPLVSSINFYRATDKQGSWAFDVGPGAEAKGFLMVIESLSDGLFLNPD